MFRVGASGLSLRAWCHRSVPLVGRRAQCLRDDQSVAVHAAPVPEKIIAMAAARAARIARGGYSGAIGLREDGSKRVVTGAFVCSLRRIGHDATSGLAGQCPHGGGYGTSTYTLIQHSQRAQRSLCVVSCGGSSVLQPIAVRRWRGYARQHGDLHRRGASPRPQQISGQDQEMGVHRHVGAAP